MIGLQPTRVLPICPSTHVLLMSYSCPTSDGSLPMSYPSRVRDAIQVMVSPIYRYICNTTCNTYRYGYNAPTHTDSKENLMDTARDIFHGLLSLAFLVGMLALPYIHSYFGGL